MKAFFWRKSFPTYLLPPLTSGMVGGAEQELGVKLPNSYIDILKVQNGGRIRYDTFLLSDRYEKRLIPVQELMGIGYDVAYSILNSPDLIAEWEMPQGLVLLEGDGHWWLMLDYRVCGPRGEPSVAYIDIELDEDILLAATFQEFLDGLFIGRTSYDFGFLYRSDNPVPLVQEINHVLNLSLTTSEWYENWFRDPSGKYWLRPNLDSWGDYEHPRHPEYDWLLQCSVTKDESEAIQAHLQAAIAYPLILLFAPDSKVARGR